MKNKKKSNYRWIGIIQLLEIIPPGKAVRQLYRYRLWEYLKQSLRWSSTRSINLITLLSYQMEWFPWAISRIWSAMSREANWVSHGAAVPLHHFFDINTEENQINFFEKLSEGKTLNQIYFIWKTLWRRRLIHLRSLNQKSLK